MGTRGTYGFRHKEKDYLSYNHFDSYPSELGGQILKELNALLSELGVEGLRERVEKIRLVNETEKPTQEDIERLRETLDLSMSRQSPEDWYCLLRNAQGSLDHAVRSGIMLDVKDFIYDSLFCEWGYIVNLDTQTLEIYKGFNKDPRAAGRYAAVTRDRYAEEFKREPYYGCRLLAEFPLTELPELDQFIDKVDPEEVE